MGNTEDNNQKGGKEKGRKEFGGKMTVRGGISKK